MIIENDIIVIHGPIIKLQCFLDYMCLLVCVEVLQPSQPNWVMSSVVSLRNHVYWAGLVL